MKAKTMRVRPLDAGWLWLESDTNLMHGSLLAIFTPPAGAGAGYVDRLVDDMRRYTSATPPFERKLASGPLARIAPRWERVERIDTDYHVRRTVLSEVTEREFGRVVSALHGAALDKAYPLWTVEIIEGLPGNRFAVLGRMHHALVDGMAAVGILGRWLSADPTERDMPPIWAYRRPPRVAEKTAMRKPIRRRPLHTTVALAGAVRRAATGVSARPWSGPRSPLNTPITADRRVATQSFDLDRFRAVADSADATINDVLLAVCAGGLRRYLDETGDLPDRPLITNMPVSVRPSDSQDASGNAISWAMLSLATHIADPAERFAAIRAATTQAKEQLSRMPGGVIDAYTMLAVAPILGEQLLGIGGRVRPIYNVPISNVPGPRSALFYNGASLDHVHAMTVLYGGQALNIVALSYGNTLELAFTACATALPHVQRLSSYCADALDELEKVLS